MKHHIATGYGTHEKASARIHELERQLGLPHSTASEFITDAWDRLSLLEEMATAKGAGPAPAAPPAKPGTTRQPTKTEIVAAKPVCGVNRIARAFASAQRR